MAEVKTIKIDTDPRVGTLGIAWRHAVIWTYLVGAEGISHWWFGGSWVIDMMILVGLITMMFGAVTKATGTVVSLTPAEIRLWVAAGMPSDVKAWKETKTKVSVVA